MLKINQKVPDFELAVFHKNSFKKIKLSQYKNKWLIIIFYPGDFTFVCPTELRETAERYKDFQKRGAEVFSISTDSVYSHKAWHDRSPSISQIEYPMAADQTGEFSRAFGVYIEEEGVCQRATFIIDPSGLVKAMDIHDNDIGRNINEVYRKFESAKYVHDHQGEVSPASWQPGKKTIKPGIKLVGKI